MSREPDYKQFNTDTAKKLGEQTHPKWTFLHAIMATAWKDLGGKASKVGIFLAFRVSEEKGYAWPSRKQIADGTGLSEEDVSKAIAELRKKGWFFVRRPSRAERNQYWPSYDRKPLKRECVSKESGSEPAADAAAGLASTHVPTCNGLHLDVQRDASPHAAGYTSGGATEATSGGVTECTLIYREHSELQSWEQSDPTRKDNDAAGAAPVRAPIASRLGEKEVPVDLSEEKPAGKRLSHVPPPELRAAYDRLMEVWPGTSHPIGTHTHHRPALGEIMMQGWTIGQILDRVRQGKFPESMHIMSFFRVEFDLKGKHTEKLAREDRREFWADARRRAEAPRSWDAGVDEDDDEDRRQEKHARRQERRFPSRVAEEHAPF